MLLLCRGVAPSQGHAPATGYGYSAVNGLHEEAEATEVTHSSSRTQQALLQGLATMRARYGTHSTVASMA